MNKLYKFLFINLLCVTTVVFLLFFYGVYIVQKNLDEDKINWIPYTTDTLSYDKYLISNNKCQMPDLSPWNRDAMAFYQKKSYATCTDKPLLSEIEKVHDRVFLVIKEDAKSSYCRGDVSCCYRNVTRISNAKVPDDKINVSTCKRFQDKVEIHNDVVKVSCHCGLGSFWTREIYENTHAISLITPETRRKKKIFKETRPPSVLFIGIDSISRLNFIRTLPKTLNFMKSRNWIEYKSYNKVGLNTFPNVIAILSGHSYSSAMNISNLKDDFADKYDLIWKYYQKWDYVTAYAEDVASINTFNYYKQGFFKKPVDFYFRHYVLATDELPARWEDGVLYCAGPEIYGERILNVAKDFSKTFIKQPNFGFFWMNSFSHDEVNAPGKLDGVIRQFFVDLEKDGVTKNTIIIFLSDHGIRFGPIRLTFTGWHEERLPFLYFWIPESFRKDHPNEYENLLKNSRRLTTPYDLHVTLHDILNLSGFNHSVKPSFSCPKCRSLFQEIDEYRSCEDAQIDIDWCTCISYKQFDANNPLVSEIAKFALAETRKEIFRIDKEKAKLCAPLKVNKIIRARISSNKSDSAHWKNTYIMVMFETFPKITLEATVRLETKNAINHFYLQGKVNRIDLYKYTGKCVDDEKLKKYCYCNWKKNYMSFLSDWFDA